MMMPQKKIAIALVLSISALNVFLIAFGMQKTSELSERMAETQAREMKALGDGLKRRAKTSFHTGYHMIGGLVRSNYWTDVLPVGGEQEAVIRKLDQVLWDARIIAASHEAKHLETLPANYLDYLKNSFARHSEAVNHGQLMVLAGLLTRPQADFVVYRHISDREKNWSSDRTIQYLLGIRSESQKKKLAALGGELNRKTKSLYVRSMDPRKDPEEIKAEIKKHKSVYSESSNTVLTPSQQRTWQQLTQERQPPSSAPEMPVLTNAKRGQFKVRERSEFFRVLSENEEAFEIDPEQKRILDDLRGVIQVGLFWLGSTEAAQDAMRSEAEPAREGGVVQSVDEFLKHAEQVALFGILTEHQADQVVPKLGSGEI